MVRIALLSDSHSNIDDAAFKYFDDVDEIWHAGDIGNIAIYDKLSALKPLRAVYGNIDGGELRKILPEKLCFTIEGLKVFMVHIGGYPGRYERDVEADLLREKPGLFISGHSHILKVMKDKNTGMLHINPGAVGNSGFHKVRTFVLFEIESSAVRNLRVVELGPK